MVFCTFAELVPPNDRKLQGVRVKLLKEQHHYNIMPFLGFAVGYVIQTSGKTDSMGQRVKGSTSIDHGGCLDKVPPEIDHHLILPSSMELVVFDKGHR